MFKYQKAHPRVKRKIVVIFSVFLRVFVNELWLTKKKKDPYKLYGVATALSDNGVNPKNVRKLIIVILRYHYNNYCFYE